MGDSSDLLCVFESIATYTGFSSILSHLNLTISRLDSSLPILQIKKLRLNRISDVSKVTHRMNNQTPSQTPALPSFFPQHCLQHENARQPGVRASLGLAPAPFSEPHSVLIRVCAQSVQEDV